MKDSDRFALQSETAKREYNTLVDAINQLPETQQPSAEQAAKLTELRTQMDGLETRRAAALATEQRDTTEHVPRTSPATAARTKHGASCAVGPDSAATSLLHSPASCLTAQKPSCRPRPAATGAVPLGAVPASGAPPCRTAPSTRAVTPSPTTADENLAGIVPAIFDRSAAAWLGIEMPTVGTGDAGYPILSNFRHWRAESQERSRRRKRGRFLRHDGATAAPNWFVPLHGGRCGPAGRYGGCATGEPERGSVVTLWTTSNQRQCQRRRYAQRTAWRSWTIRRRRLPVRGFRALCSGGSFAR